jgi:hypothetical protein
LKKYHLIKEVVIKLISSIVLFLSFQSDVISQADSLKYNYNIKADFHYGTLLAPKPSMRYLIKGHIPAFDLRFSKTTNGKNLWEQLYRYPETGCALYFCDFSNPHILGKAIASYYYINIHILNKKNYSFDYSYGIGLAYLTKKFETDKNYMNIAISSNFNVYLGLALNFECVINPYVNFVTAISYTHFSNGSVSQPNLGLNIVSLQTGLRYKIHYNDVKINNSIPVFRKKDKYILNYSLGWKGISPPEPKKYFTSSLSFNYQRLISYKRSIGIGTDVFYDKSLAIKLKRDSISGNNLNILRNGVYISHELFFGNTSLVTQFGVYIYQKYYGDGDFYSRLGLRYKFSRKFSANIFLKTHFASADFIEWGVGYHFN